MNRPVVPLFQKGLTDPEIEEKMKCLPFQLPEEVARLYKWRNGTRIDTGATYDDLNFFPGFYLMALEEAIEQYLPRQEAVEWKPGWLPLFENGGGDFYQSICLPGPVPTAEIVGWIHGEPDQDVEYLSLTTMCQTILTAFDQGVIHLDGDNLLQCDDFQYSIIGHRYNPGLGAWQ